MRKFATLVTGALAASQATQAFATTPDKYEFRRDLYSKNNVFSERNETFYFKLALEALQAQLINSPEKSLGTETTIDNLLVQAFKSAKNYEYGFG